MKKRIVSALALVMALVMVCLAMASCGAKQLSGTYEMKSEAVGVVIYTVAYTFSGEDVTVKRTYLNQDALSFEVKGKYTIDTDKGEITITYTSGDTENEDAQEYAGTMDFAEVKDGIKLGGVLYTKK